MSPELDSLPHPFLHSSVYSSGKALTAYACWAITQNLTGFPRLALRLCAHTHWGHFQSITQSRVLLRVKPRAKYGCQVSQQKSYWRFLQFSGSSEEIQFCFQRPTNFTDGVIRKQVEENMFYFLVLYFYTFCEKFSCCCNLETLFVV